MRSNRMPGRAWLLVAATLATAAACGPFRRGNPEQDALIYFTNQSTEQAAVYAVSSGEQTRIGTVLAGQTDTLKVPETMVARGTVNLAVTLLARSETPSSGAIPVAPGSRHEVRLTADLRQLLVFSATLTAREC